ncbi:metal-dependent hydrolase [Natronococcus sp. JC468]|uniref:metal-dependent hydrolase n=1 Tax=Natronococcus sp. JC468 TaxID=1961921 RepID=UPI00143A9D59|nr:metal-dependent hydrolase [Natronococcus sp. JC468]NKE37934.1 metal-dependent hydrolase [Natronococcus sp. JC468]
MYRGGHVGLNALLYAPFLPLASHYWSPEGAVLGAGLALGLANLPDIDESISRLRHRGPTHTLWFAVLVGLLAGAGTALVLPATPGALPFGFVVGTASVLAHLAGDIVTPMGISPLAPLSEVHVTLDWFESKNPRINRRLFLIGSTTLLASLAVTVAFAASLEVPT